MMGQAGARMRTKTEISGIPRCATPARDPAIRASGAGVKKVAPEARRGFGGGERTR
jgi:hypothetical protein